MPIISLSPDITTEAGDLNFTVSLDEASAGPISVEWRILSGTALEGLDLFTSSGTLTIPAGSTSSDIFINLSTGTSGEIDENLTIELFNPVNATLAGDVNVLRATGVIQEGTSVSLFVSDPVLVEGDDGTTDAVFEVRLSRAHNSALSFAYETVDGTAQAGSDYQATSGTVNFGANQTVATIVVPVFGDEIVEASEYFSLVVTPNTPVIANGTDDATGIAEIFDDDAGGNLPTLSITDTRNVESGDLQFVLSLDKPSLGPVTVGYRTVSGTALEGLDLFTAEGTATIDAGKTSTTININPSTGTSGEIDENLILEIFDPTNAELSGGVNVIRATGVILEGGSVSLFVTDPILNEGNRGQTEAVFEIQLSRPALTDLTFNYATADGTALAGEDYVAVDGSVTFSAGQTRAVVRVPVLGDRAKETLETFSLVVTPDLASIPVIANNAADAAGIAEIVDDDGGGGFPVINIASARNLEAGDIQFIVTLDKASAGPVSVNWRTISGTSLEGLDFFTAEGTLEIPAGKTTGTININPSTGTSGEIDENFTIELFDPLNGVLAGGGSTSRATAVVLEGSSVSLFVSDVVMVERDSGERDAVFEVRLSRPSDVDLSFTYKTVNGSAESGSDYEAVSGSLTFKAGQTLASVAVPVFGDGTIEDTENFSLVVTPTVASLPAIANGADDAAGIAEILDDDSGLILPTLSVSPARNLEAGDLQFVVSLDRATTGPVTVNYTLRDGTALGGVDFFSTTSSVTIDAGETTATINVNPSTGTSGEIDENLILELFQPINATLAGGENRLRVNGTILEGEAVSLFTTPATAFEGDGKIRFDLTLSRPLDTNVTIDYQTQNGTAQAGSDYRAKSGSVEFLAGQTVASVYVDLISRAASEGTETFQLVYTTPLNINGTKEPATGRIFDGPGPDKVGFAVYAGLSQDGFQDIFSRFRVADNVAKRGDTILVVDPEEVGGIGRVDVTTNNLTISGARPFNGTFDLDAGIRNLTLSGTTNADIIGNGASNRLTGSGGANTISGLIGADTLIGRGGNDSLIGGAGRDLLDGDIGRDTLIGGNQNDTLRGDGGNDSMNGGAGNDTMNGGGGADRMFGAAGADVMNGATGNDRMFGGDANDALNGAGGRDRLEGNGGDDTLNGGIGNDTLVGGDDADSLLGGVGDDAMNGGAGRDILRGNDGADTLNGSGGADNLVGGDGNDLLIGGGGNDFASGGGGADVMRGLTGSDLLLGNAGRDRLIGGGGDDTMRGAGGADTISGGAGEDVLDGGGGNDSLIGGADADHFEIRAGAGEDVIADFDLVEDMLHLDDALWAGTLNAGQVVNSFASQDGGDTVFLFDNGEELRVVGVADADDLIGRIDFI